MKRVRNIPGGPTPATLPKGHTAIYSLHDPVTGAARWVGKTVRPRVRWLAHISEARCGLANDAKNAWVRGLVRRGLRPVMRVRTVVVPRSGRRPMLVERAWIARLLRKGEPLLNLSDRPAAGP